MSLSDRLSRRKRPPSQQPTAPLFDSRVTRREAYLGVQRSGRAAENRDAVLAALKELGEASMRQVARHIDFEINRVTQPFKDLREDGIIEKCGKRVDPETGYPQVLYRVKPN